MARDEGALLLPRLLRVAYMGLVPTVQALWRETKDDPTRAAEVAELTVQLYRDTQDWAERLFERWYQGYRMAATGGDTPPDTPAMEGKSRMPARTGEPESESQASQEERA